MNRPIKDRNEFHNYDFADFAQEFLGRNPEYQAQYERLGNAACRDPGARATIEMAHSWGLEFPFRARHERLGKPCDLARMRSAIDRHPQNRGRYAPSGSTEPDICKS